jgi:hypothetical protein
VIFCVLSIIIVQGLILINLSKIMKFRQVILKVLKMEVAVNFTRHGMLELPFFCFANRQFIGTHLN